MTAEPKSVTFETTVAVTGNNTGIVVTRGGDRAARGRKTPACAHQTNLTNTSDAAIRRLRGTNV
jgi:hypothetical protein